MQTRKVAISMAILLIILTAVSAYSESPKRDRESVPDPSLRPTFLHPDTIPEYRWRAYGDIDKDGIEDLVVSESLSHMSQNGVKFVVYFGDSSGQYIPYDTAFGSPGDLCFERSHKGIRMWTSFRWNAGEGTVGPMELTDTGFGSSHHILLFKGDSGTDMGNAILKAIFENCDVEFRVERYRIIEGEIEVSDH